MISEDTKQKLVEAGYQGGYELSELINACGRTFFGIMTEDHAGHWIAMLTTEKLSNIPGERKDCVSKEDAVAKCWIQHFGKKPETPPPAPKQTIKTECQNCFYHQVIEETETGTCKRYPKATPEAEQPVTKKNDFCGEFKEK